MKRTESEKHLHHLGWERFQPAVESDCSTSRRKISFSKRNELGDLNVKRGGRLLAIISHASARHYWYKMARTENDEPWNTLSVSGSAVTLKGCKAEIVDYFGK